MLGATSHAQLSGALPSATTLRALGSGRLLSCFALSAQVCNQAGLCKAGLGGLRPPSRSSLSGGWYDSGEQNGACWLWAGLSPPCAEAAPEAGPVGSGGVYDKRLAWCGLGPRHGAVCKLPQPGPLGGSHPWFFCGKDFFQPCRWLAGSGFTNPGGLWWLLLCGLFKSV